VTYHGSLSSFAWFGTSNLTVYSPHSRSTLVKVSGSGSLYLVSEGGHGAPSLAGAPLGSLGDPVDPSGAVARPGTAAAPSRWLVGSD
jgi:hypothetical protein